MVREILAIALGGMLGSLARHFLSGWLRSFHPTWLPLGTLVVNVLGCLAIGYLFKWATERELVGTWWELGLRVGVLGGLTTFSSFALEVALAWQWQNRPVLAAGILLAHVSLCLGAVLLGMSLVAKP